MSPNIHTPVVNDRCYIHIYRNVIPTFGNRCLSAIGGAKQRSRLAGWVQLSAAAAPGPHGVPPVRPMRTQMMREIYINSGAATVVAFFS